MADYKAISIKLLKIGPNRKEWEESYSLNDLQIMYI